MDKTIIEENKAQESASLQDGLNLKNNFRPLYYIISELIISKLNLDLDSERERVWENECLNLKNKFRDLTPLWTILTNDKHYAIADHLYQNKACCLDDLVKVLKPKTNVSKSTARSVLQSLMPFGFVSVGMEYCHQLRRGNEVIIYKWKDATESDLRKAMNRVPEALGLTAIVEKAQEYNQLELDCIEYFSKYQYVNKSDLISWLGEYGVPPKLRMDSATRVSNALRDKGVEVRTQSR